ncbi:hypothetical protein Tsubulata_028438 [Turnera subulata]|uniref:Pectinesterase inhibitor domain-containing protein n=1 Tax=Turnera subulata TaxID=218843 RepID=A0A9Q0FPW1_9ROSI|nr:hypothetical protein Tsubulata_028438 [Turnera subulata]
MASLFLLPHFLPSLLLIALSFTFLLHSHNLPVVKADDNLIKQECGYADAPALCIQCVKSNPKALEADSVGIATIIVNCVSEQANALGTNLSKLAYEAKDKNLTTLYQEGSKVYLDACKDLSTVISSLGKGDYDSANHGLGTTLRNQGLCYVSFQSYEPDVPERIVYDMGVCTALSESAMRIIDRL